MKKTILAIALTIAMLLMALSGCGTAGTVSTNESAGSTENTSTEETDAAAEEVEEASGVETESVEAEAASEEPEAIAEENSDTQSDAAEESGTVDADRLTAGAESTVSYPLVEEPITLTYFVSPMTNVLNYTSSYNDHYLLDTVEELTGIRLVYDEVSPSAISEQFNLRVAANDLCDFMPVESYYSGGLAKAYEEDVIIDIYPYLEEWGPDILYVLESSGETIKELTTDDGMLLHLHAINASYNPVQGLNIRQDWLDELGLDVPETTSELLEVLRAFQNNYDVTNAYMLGSEGVLEGIYGAFGIQAVPLAQSAFGSNLGYEVGMFQMDGVVYAGPMEDGYRDYLEYMHTLYAEGLISADFYSFDTLNTNSVKGAGEYGFWNGNADDFSVVESYAEEGDTIDIRGIAPIVVNEGDVYHFGEKETYQGIEQTSITTGCEYPEYAVAFLNYFFYGDGYIMSSFGTEGLSFEYDDDGQPHLTDIVMNNPDGIGTNVAANLYGFTWLPTYVDNTRLWGGYLDKELEAIELWRETVVADYTLPYMTLTAEESAEYAAVATDLYTYEVQAMLQFITGAVELNDETWAEFQNNLVSMNIDTCIKIFQGALDRYNEK